METVRMKQQEEKKVQSAPAATPSYSGGRFGRARKLFAAYGYKLDTISDEKLLESGVLNRIAAGPHSLGEIVSAMALFDYYKFSFEEITGKMLVEAVKVSQQTRQPLIIAANLIASVIRGVDLNAMSEEEKKAGRSSA
jgi:hypothetical protein